MQKAIKKDLKNFQILQAALIGACLVVTAYVGISFSRFMHRQISDEIQLRAANQQLDASNQQLSAANQQLSSNEQQLRAANQQLQADEQQLRANEQQLRAANQQLTANEQQLRASNQQLTANEQQLRAANQQLSADEQQLRASNQQLAVSEKRFRDFFKNAPVGFHIFGPDQIITDINDDELDMIGYTRSEIVGKKTWANLITPSQKKQYQQHWNDITTKGQVKDIEYTLVHKQGHLINVILNASSRFDEDNNLINTRGSVLNITERKRAEKERKRFLKSLSAKNKELQSVVYVASHDLRTPLVNIQGFAGELAKSCAKLSELLNGKDAGIALKRKTAPLIDENIPESLKFINSSVNMMGRLLDGLLRISRIGSAEINIEPIEINKLVKNVQQSLEFQIQQSGATVNIKKLPNCHGDIDLLSQVFANLLDNAIKYLDSNRKGKVTISARVEDNSSIYCVEDNGIGIDHKHQEKVFEIFHRLNPEGEIPGEGLGLSAVWRMLNRLDGTIMVESEPGKGSRFLVTLPNA